MSEQLLLTQTKKGILNMLSPDNVVYTKQIKDLAIEADQLFETLLNKLQLVHRICYESVLYIEDPNAAEYSLLMRDVDFKIDHILKTHCLKRNMIRTTGFDEEFTLQPVNLDISPDTSLQEFFDLNFTGYCENMSIIHAVATKSTDDLFDTLWFVLSIDEINEQYIYREIERVRYFLQIVKDAIESLTDAGAKIDEINDDLFDVYQRLYLDVQVD